jgi:hypothetical protein
MQPPPKPMSKLAIRVPQPGNTLTEYALIGLFILLVCIVAVTSLGSNLSTTFLGMVPLPAKDEPRAASAPNPAGSLAASFATGSHPITITLSNGSSIHISGYSQDMVTTIETLGANGATDMLANTMQAMADQMLANGTISREGHAHLTALSNQAHYIASIEKALEQAATQASNRDEYNDTPILFNGKTYPSPQELRMLIGYYNGSHDLNDITDPMNDSTAAPETAAFQTLYKQALQSDALKDPVALQTIQTLSKQVALLSSVSSVATVKIVTAEIPPTDMVQYMAGDISHEKSGGICKTGNGEDNGVTCTD